MAKTPVLGRYQIQKELGRGAMGRVFLARDPDIQRQVAIKTIQVFASLPDADRGEARERFTREAQAAGKLLHPGIVTLFDVGEHQGVPFLAMEYVEGTPLDSCCRKERLLPVDVVLDVIRQAAEALHYAHGEGIIHRDIKPANLMLVGGTTVKIMDFGLAKAPATQLTSDGTLLGTPGYMSPEQIRGGQVDGRSDLFSLACVLYELLTGRKPFDGDSISSVVYRVVHEDPPDPAAGSDRVGPELASFLMTALSKDPEDRPADGQAFADRLRELAGDLAGSGPAGGNLLDGDPPAGLEPDVELPPPVHARRSRKRSGRSVAGPVLLVLAAALAVAGWWFRDDLARLWERLAPEPAPPAVEWYEATVRTEPDGLPVLLDGKALEGDRVRFPSTAPHGSLTAELECRMVTHALDPLDAGGEINLVLDPIRLSLELPVPVEGVGVRLNGADLGPVPGEVELDLCRDNTLEFHARGYYPLELALPAAVTPLEARTVLGAVAMERIPTGTLELPAPGYPLVVRVDGQRREADGGLLEVEAGERRIRITNERYWIDLSARATVEAGKTSVPFAALPKLAELSVLAYPPNCRVLLRKGDGDRWKFIKNTPLTGYRIAPGDYHLRVELITNGDARERDIRLGSGANPPVRISFGGN